MPRLLPPRMAASRPSWVLLWRLCQGLDPSCLSLNPHQLLLFCLYFSYFPGQAFTSFRGGKGRTPNVKLPTGTLSPHLPSEALCRCSPCALGPRMTCPTWQQLEEPSPSSCPLQDLIRDPTWPGGLHSLPSPFPLCPPC